MKHSLRSIVIGFKRYGYFTYTELGYLLLTGLVFGFIFSFRLWGDELGQYSLSTGVFNLSLYIFVSFISLFVLHIGMRIAAVELGYKPQYIPWKIGLVANTFVAFLSNGLLVFLSPGGFELKRLEGMQLGHLYQGVAFKHRSTIVFWGFFFVSIYSAIIMLIFGSLLGVPDFGISIINVIYFICLWSLFPIDIVLRIWFKSVPISNGTSLIYGGWSKALGTVSYLVLSYFLLLFLNPIIAVLLSIVLTVIIYLVFFLYFDKQVGLYTG